MMVYPTHLHWRHELAKMRRLLGTAAAIVMTTPEAARRIREAFPELADRPIVSIPNGYRPGRFRATPPSRTDSAFRIVHTGYLHTKLGIQQRRTAPCAGCSAADRRRHPHSVARLPAERDRPARSSIRTRCGESSSISPGVLSRATGRRPSRSPLRPRAGTISRTGCDPLMRIGGSALPAHAGLPPGKRSGTVPGKTYEYSPPARPILAAVPEGDARDILMRAGNTRICAPDDVEAMADAILKQQAGKAVLPRRDLEFISQFDYRKLKQGRCRFVGTCEHRQGRGALPARLDSRLGRGCEAAPKGRRPSERFALASSRGHAGWVCHAFGRPADPTRGRGSGAHLPGTDERRDRHAVVRVRPHGEIPPRFRLPQDGRLEPDRGHVGLRPRLPHGADCNR